MSRSYSVLVWVVAMLAMFNIAFLGWGLYDQVRTQRTQTTRISTQEGVAPLMLVNEQLTANRLMSPNNGKQSSSSASKFASPNSKLEATNPKSATPPVVEALAPVPANKQKGKAPPTSCWSIGPFASVSERTAAYGKLAALGNIKLVSFEQIKHLGEKYIVYLPPVKTLEEAEHKAAELRQKGMQNVTVLTQGDLARAVSLGEFATQRNASEKIASLKGVAMGAKIKALAREQLEYWLKSYESGKNGVSKDAVAKLAPVYKGLGRKSAVCK